MRLGSDFAHNLIPDVHQRYWMFLNLCTNLSGYSVPSDSRRRMKRMGEKEIIRASSSIFHLHITGYLSGPMGSLWAWYYPVARTGIVGWLRGSYPRPLTKWSNLQGSRMVWGSPNPLEIGDWLFNSWALRIRLDILGTQYHGRRWAYSHVLRTPPVIGWNQGFNNSPRLITNNQSTRWTRQAFTFVLSP